MIAAVLVVVGVVAAAFAVLFAIGERGRYLPSTWRFFRQAGFGLQGWHAYVYGRWTVRYVKTLFGIPLSATPSPGERHLADHYHGKVLTHEHAHAIVELDRDIPLQDLEQIIPYPVARNIVLNAQPEIAAYECACRHARPTHCEPTQVCMVVGQPMVDFVLEHHPKSARRLTRQEALDLLDAEHALGHVHSAWFKDAMMNRFYSICNCCKCCCGGIAAMRRGNPMMASSGYVAEIDGAVCAHCGDCVEACPFRALAQTEDATAVNWDLCMGCGVCEVACSTGAISIVRDARKGIPLDVRALPLPGGRGSARVSEPRP